MDEEAKTHRVIAICCAVAFTALMSAATAGCSFVYGSETSVKKTAAERSTERMTACVKAGGSWINDEQCISFAGSK